MAFEHVAQYDLRTWNSSTHTYMRTYLHTVGSWLRGGTLIHRTVQPSMEHGICEYWHSSFSWTRMTERFAVLVHPEDLLVHDT